MPTAMTPQPDWVYYAAGIGLIVASVAAWIGSFYRWPGNWLVVVLSGVSAYCLPQKNGNLGITWTTVAVLAGVAVFGELLEYFAGRSSGITGGVHRRSLVITMVGGISGALIGSALPLPIPIIGNSLALLIGILAGVAGGAYFGEVLYSDRKGLSRLRIHTSLVTRLLGTVGKLVAGLTMVAILAAALFPSAG